jgi:hypothetical protein
VVFSILLSNLSMAVEELRKPQWIGVTKEVESVNLQWFRVQNAVAYIVERKVGESGDFMQVARVTIPTFKDFDLAPAQVYFYRIIPLDKNGAKGSVSDVRYIELASIEQGIVSPPLWDSHNIQEDGIALAWRHESYDQVLAYNLYRKKEGESDYTLIASSMSSIYLDRDVIRGIQYEYTLTALSTKLQESDNSSVLTVLFTEELIAPPEDERLSNIRTIEEVVSKTELERIYSWEDYGFISPVDVEYHTLLDRLYVSDSGTGLITVIGPQDDVIQELGGSGGFPLEFDKLLGIAVDPGGYVYAVDAYRGEIAVFSPRGTFERRIRLEDDVREYFGTDLYSKYPGFRFGILDVLVGIDGSLYIVDNPNGWIYVLDKNDKLINVISEKGYEPGKMQYPTFAAMDEKGRIVVSDTLNGRVQLFDMDGSFFDQMGERGPGIGQFLRPKGIVADRKGSYFIADSQHNVIQVFDSQLRFIALLGDERNLPIDLGSPNGLAFIEPDRLVICERLARRVQVRRLTSGLAMGDSQRSRFIAGKGPEGEAGQ